MNRALLFLLTAFSLLAQQTVNNFTVKTNLYVGDNIQGLTLNGYNIEDIAIASSLNDRLKTWTSGQSYQVTSATYDSDGVVTTATVTWPDGSTGTFTTTTKNSTFLAVDAFTITHTDSGKTVVQSAVTRDSTGAVTTKPALTITEP